jgi:hypothetical protein
MPKKQLEKKIYPIPNSDKKSVEKWEPGRDLMNLPCPSRVIFCGRPNSGKSTVIKNIILKSEPAYKQVYLLHPVANEDPEHEYQDLGDNVILLDDVPPVKYWQSNKRVKKLLIIDDIDLNGLNKVQKTNLDRLFGFCSSHYMLSIFTTQQDFHQLPTCVRRNSNVFCLWKSRDSRNNKIIASKVGLNPDEFNGLFDNYCPNYFDFLVINWSRDAPVFLSKSFYTPIIESY